MSNETITLPVASLNNLLAMLTELPHKFVAQPINYLLQEVQKAQTAAAQASVPAAVMPADTAATTVPPASAAPAVSAHA
ncbi:MAG: hypothetical protein P4M00_18845 [Azospirillaceae bacterium]|nr:hypothetical protein [Azospirillaceae bacterium]